MKFAATIWISYNFQIKKRIVSVYEDLRKYGTYLVLETNFQVCKAKIIGRRTVEVIQIYQTGRRCENIGGQSVIQGLLMEQVLVLYVAKSAPSAPLVPSALH